MMLRWLPLALLPVPAVAEGARQTFDCRATQTCDGAGACRSSDEATLFTLDPVSVGMHGEGEYAIAYGDVQAQAVMLTYSPIIIWNDPYEMVHYLTVTGGVSSDAATFLWQSISLPGPSASTVRFLTCEVLQ